MLRRFVLAVAVLACLTSAAMANPGCYFPGGQGGYPSYQPGGYPTYPGGYPGYQPGGYPTYPGGYPTYPGGYPTYPNQQMKPGGQIAHGILQIIDGAIQGRP